MTGNAYQRRTGGQRDGSDSPHRRALVLRLVRLQLHTHDRETRPTRVFQRKEQVQNS